MIRFIKNNWVPIAAVLFNLGAAINTFHSNIGETKYWYCFLNGACFGINIILLICCLYTFIRDLKRHKNDIKPQTHNNIYSKNYPLIVGDRVRIMGGLHVLETGTISKIRYYMAFIVLDKNGTNTIENIKNLIKI